MKTAHDVTELQLTELPEKIAIEAVPLFIAVPAKVAVDEIVPTFADESKKYPEEINPQFCASPQKLEAPTITLEFAE
jgi:hypothetical protein